MNQVEVNIRDHQHGVSGVSSAILNAATTTVDVTNTVTETNLYSFSVPGGTLGSSNAVRLTLIGDRLENAAGTLTIRIYYGATVILAPPALDATNTANREVFSLLVNLHAKGATNSQVADGFLFYSNASAAIADGTMDIVENVAGNIQPLMGLHNAVAVDSTVANVVKVTAQWSAASTSLSVRLLSARLEIIR